MSGALIDFVEARLDAINGVRSELVIAREPVPPPVVTPPHRMEKRHVKKTRDESKVTDSLHESFGWLEEYVDCKLEMMKKIDSWTSRGSLMSLGSSTRSFDTTDSPRGHRHRRSLSRRDSLDLELKETNDKGHHRRMHSRRESILIGLFDKDTDDAIVEPDAITPLLKQDQDKCQDAIVEAALAA